MLRIATRLEWHRDQIMMGNDEWSVDRQGSTVRGRARDSPLVVLLKTTHKVAALRDWSLTDDHHVIDLLLRDGRLDGPKDIKVVSAGDGADDREMGVSFFFYSDTSVRPKVDINKLCGRGCVFWISGNTHPKIMTFEPL
jgi:hypothetical protein